VIVVDERGVGPALKALKKLFDKDVAPALKRHAYAEPAGERRRR
jgi:hypothetical protein